jgi:hypothetical protein
MKQGSFSYEVYIAAPPAQVAAFLADLRNQSKFHPLIVKIEEAPAPEGVLRRYFITDRLQFGPFHFKIVYRADVLRATEREVLTEAYQSPQTYVTNLSTCLPEGTGTRFTETITLKALDLLFGYAFGQAKTAHAELVQQIKRGLEAGLPANSQ